MSPARSCTPTAARSPVTKPAGPVAERRRRLAQFPTGVEGELGEYVAPTRGSTQPVECLQRDDRADRCPADPAASRVWEIRPVAPAPHQAWRAAEPQLIPGAHKTPVCRSRPSGRKATRGFRAPEPPGRTGRSDRAPERRRRRSPERGTAGRRSPPVAASPSD